jgi:hypothetical protein
MGYEDMAASADKWLHADGSVTTLAGGQILPADSERAAEYTRREPNAAKWLLPDGTVTSALPMSGGNSSEAARIDGIEAAADEARAQAAAALAAATGAGVLAETARQTADGAAAVASSAGAEAALAKSEAAGAAAAAASALAKAPKRAFLIADITAEGKSLAVGDCRVRLHKSGDYCQIFAASLSGKTLEWSSSTLYDGGGVQNRYGSGTAEQQIENDIGYGGNANRLAANIRIGSEGWRLEVAETGSGGAGTLAGLWAALEKMEATV